MRVSLISLLLGSAAADYTNPYQQGSTSWYQWNTDHSSSGSTYTPRSTYSQPSYSYSNPTYSYYNTASPSYSYYNTANPSYSYSGTYGTNYYGYSNSNPTYTSYYPSYTYVQPSQSYYTPTTTYSYYQPTYTNPSYYYYTPSYSYPTYSTNSYNSGVNPYSYGSPDWHSWNNGHPGVSQIYMKAQNGPDMEGEEGEATGVEVQGDKVVLKDEELNPSYTTKDANELPIAIIAISVLIILALSALAGRYFYKTINMKSNTSEQNVETNVAPESIHVELADEKESSKVDVSSSDRANSNQNQSYEK